MIQNLEILDQLKIKNFPLETKSTIRHYLGILLDYSSLYLNLTSFFAEGGKDYV